MKQIAMSRDLPFLPEEIIRNILILLPVKSLIRFGCVCKHWKKLIRTPSFICDHLRYSSTHQNPSLLLQRRYGVWLLDCKMELHEVNIAPFFDSSTTFKIVGSCNGLVCVDVDPDSVFSPSLSLWNPATREIRQLPPNRKVLQLPLYTHLFFRVGFGFSPIDNDYKIVVIYFAYPLAALSHAVAYSLSSESWKEVEFGIENVAIFHGSVNVSGAMFWLGFSWKDSIIGSFHNVIVSFDIAKEVFTLITLDCLIPRPTLSVYENKLAILCLSEMEDSEALIELWVMEDGSGASWAKKYCSCLIPSVVRPVMTIWMNQIVCDERECYHEAKITLLNITTNEWKAINIRKCGRANGSGFIYNHAESLVPIG
ncbi:hypothetical protein K1719_001730 [Acacia pycnantha]|nr:hypothetical protein K1719_001730 [Acacia pycnantha]